MSPSDSLLNLEEITTSQSCRQEYPVVQQQDPFFISISGVVSESWVDYGDSPMPERIAKWSGLDLE